MSMAIRVGNSEAAWNRNKREFGLCRAGNYETGGGRYPITSFSGR